MASLVLSLIGCSLRGAVQVTERYHGDLVSAAVAVALASGSVSGNRTITRSVL